jgi:signal transduction histidine kinase
MARKVAAVSGKARRQRSTVFIGLFITAVLILSFNVLLPIIFNQLSFIPFAALFILPFIALISYSIYRQDLFDIKVAATAVLGFLVTVFIFVNIVYSTSLSEIVLNVTAFVIALLGSVRIVQDTVNLKRLTEEMQKTNERQENLIHFIGHEVKGFLTKAEGAFAALLEGDFGTLPNDLRPFVSEALKQTRGGVTSVSDILEAANLKKGVVEFKKEPIDLAVLTEDAVTHARPAAQGKGLSLSFAKGEGDFHMQGDARELEDHVLRNLIENAIAYTPKGSVEVSLARDGGTLVLAVKDTGIGITPDDRTRLFTEGGHGRESIRVNVHSTGYGLYIAKSVVETHGGKIRAESGGPGKGSMFIVELPVG